MEGDSKLVGDMFHLAGCFRLVNVPIPCQNQVTSIVGAKGVGKSLILRLLGGAVRPNFGDLPSRSWPEIIDRIQDVSLKNYYLKLTSVDISERFIFKFQYIRNPETEDDVTWEEYLRPLEELGNLDKIIQILELENMMNISVDRVVEGNLQLFLIAKMCIASRKVYIFDEPFQYLDIRQKFLAGRAIRSLLETVDNACILLTDNEISGMEYISDVLYVVEGEDGAVGQVSGPYTPEEGFDHLFDRYDLDMVKTLTGSSITYDEMQKIYTYPYSEDVRVSASSGSCRPSEIIIVLGEIGVGKSTFLRHLKTNIFVNISYKPQRLSPTFKGDVQSLLESRIYDSFHDDSFRKEILLPLKIHKLLSKTRLDLSGNEIQRIALVLVLGKPADMYIIDDLSRYLDIEMKFIAVKVIKKFIKGNHKMAIIVVNDLSMAITLADRVIIFERNLDGTIASPPLSVSEGLNKLLMNMGETMCGGNNNRPHVNKVGSVQDSLQRDEGIYFM